VTSTPACEVERPSSLRCRGVIVTGHRNPYVVGNFLKLRIRGDAPHLGSARSLRAEIFRLIQPFTMSVAIVVHLHEPALSIKGTFFLKLYDRCCASQCRCIQYAYGEKKEHETSTTNRDIEYHQYCCTEKGAAHLGETLEGYGDNEDDEEGLNGEQIALRPELEIHSMTMATFDSELAVYRHLQDLQGKSIPRLVAEVELPGFYSQHCSPDVSFEIGSIPGLLVEYIDCFTLQNLCFPSEGYEEPPVPRQHFQTITDTALEIVRTIMARGVVNRDSRPRNTLVR
jgi:hypothetical protein